MLAPTIPRTALASTLPGDLIPPLLPTLSSDPVSSSDLTHPSAEPESILLPTAQTQLPELSHTPAPQTSFTVTSLPQTTPTIFADAGTSTSLPNHAVTALPPNSPLPIQQTQEDVLIHQTRIADRANLAMKAAALLSTESPFNQPPFTRYVSSFINNTFDNIASFLDVSAS